MIAQEIFDKVVNHLRKQGKRSVNIADECCYRSSTGLKCAAGCLIEDHEYRSEMERRTIKHLIETDSSLQRYFNHIDLIQKLQDIHDGQNEIGKSEYYGLSNEEILAKWEIKFEKLAKDFGLQYQKYDF